MPRTHDRNHFYKFATLGGARAMITERTLKWSSPLLFNDPFDTQTRLVADLDPEAFAARFAELYSSILMDDPIPDYIGVHAPLHAVALYMRENFSPAQKAEAIETVRLGALRTAAEADDQLAKFSDEISKQLHHGRAICLAEEINNVVMWSHYA